MWAWVPAFCFWPAREAWSRQGTHGGRARGAPGTAQHGQSAPARELDGPDRPTDRRRGGMMMQESNHTWRVYPFIEL